MLGENGMVMLDVSEAEVIPGDDYRITGVQVSYLTKQDIFDFTTRTMR